MTIVPPRREFIDVNKVPVFREEHENGKGDKLVIYRLHPKYNRDELFKILHGGNTPQRQNGEYKNPLDSHEYLPQAGSDSFYEDDDDESLELDQEVYDTYRNYDSGEQGDDEEPVILKFPSEES